MRSRLEAGFAQWLDTWRSVRWTYEPGAFASPRGQYLPDFLAEPFRCSWLDGERRAYFEVKPASFGWQSEWDEEVGPLSQQQDEAIAQEEALSARMAIILSSEPDAIVALAKQRTGGGAQFWVLERTPDDDWIQWPMEVVSADPNGFIPTFIPEGSGYQPAWPDGYWKGPRG
jgi:hypothetical protein